MSDAIEQTGESRIIRMPSVSIDEAPGKVRLKIDSHPANLAAARKAIEALGQRNGFDASAVADLGLCVNEALANVIRHAYDGAPDKPIEITAECDEQAMRLTIRDWGKGIDPLKLPPRPRDPLTPGGLGLVCLCRMMDCCDFAPQDQGMLLTLVRNRNHRDAAVG